MSGGITTLKADREPRAVLELPWEGVLSSDAVPVVRIGIDFGTSTTQVAYRIGSDEPRMLRLERLTNHLPSYFALDSKGAPQFGGEAAIAPVSIHSIKILLAADLPIEVLGGMRPSEVACLMLEEVVRRSIEQLKGLRVLPAAADVLQIATNLGCTPRFDLDQRLRLRQVAARAGLNVGLADLVEEPVAAAFELVRAAAAPEGSLLVIDVGGGTMDIAIVRSDVGKQRVDIYATSGHELGGDKYTEKIEARIKQAVAATTGLEPMQRRDLTLIWQRAEAAKIALSTDEKAVVALGGIAGIDAEDLEIERAWFDRETLWLREETRRCVLNTYRVARLVLDRGGPDDPAPGTIYVRERFPGAYVRITQLWLDDDALEHLRGVVLVGGVSRDPALQRRFRGTFGAKLLDPLDFGVDPVEAIALGLARGDAITTANRRYPDWGVSAVFSDGVQTVEVPLYEPFFPAFEVRDGTTSVYERTATIPGKAAARVALVFRQVGPGRRESRWTEHPVAPGASHVTFGLDLFGQIRFRDSLGRNLVPGGSLAPWAPDEADQLASWMPPSQRTIAYADPSGWRDDTK